MGMDWLTARVPRRMKIMEWSLVRAMIDPKCENEGEGVILERLF